MTWETFYLVCFLVGLILSFVSLLGGMGHFGGHVHAPHVHLPHAGHVGICRMRGRFSSCGASGGGATRAGGSVVERVFDHDFSVLVWRGGVSADAVWQLCGGSGGGAGGDLRDGGRSDHLLFPDQGADAARA